MYTLLHYQLDGEGRYATFKDRVTGTKLDLEYEMRLRLRDKGNGNEGHWHIFDLWFDSDYVMTYTMSMGKVKPHHAHLKEPRRSVRHVMVPSTTSEKVEL